jgi:antitoxin VapB
MEIAKIEKKGREQVVNLPREFQFKGTEVYIKRIGRMVILIPKEDPWEPLMNSLDQFTDDFMAERLQPAMAERESF